MRGIEDMWFYAENRNNKWIGRVREFPDVRTRPMTNKLDALSEIVTLTSTRIREVQERMAR